MSDQPYALLSAQPLIILLLALSASPAFAQQAGATLDSVTAVGAGRYRITGTALDSKGNAACALALASGRCMFTCGPGSLRCEGGTANLPFGKFDLTDLPTEPNGTINLQVFVQGNISFIGVVNPGGGGGGSTRWNALTNVCCETGSFTYQVTVDGVTRNSTSNSCGSPSVESFASTTAGNKSYAARAFSTACNVNVQGQGTVAMADNACYRFTLNLQSGNLVNSFGSVNCPSSATAETQQEEPQATPMAIFPMEDVDPTGAGQADWSQLKSMTSP